MSQSSLHPLCGIVPPLITPLTGRDTLDVAGLERLVEHVLAGGVHGLFILGTSGEGPSLSYRLRRELIDRVCRQVGRRVPVLAGITDTSFVETLGIARHAANAGADALVVSAPYYFEAGQRELLEYVQRLLPELPLPLFLYNMPQMTKVHFGPEMLRRLVTEKGILGIKDSSGDLNYFSQVLELRRTRPEWSVLVGPEHLLVESVRRGGCGGVNGGANLFPRLFVELFKAAMAGDEARVEPLQEAVRVLDGIYHLDPHASAVVKGMKCGCAVLGLCGGFMAEPFQMFGPGERQRVAAILEQVAKLEAALCSTTGMSNEIKR